MRIGVFLVTLAMLATPAPTSHAAPEEPKAKPAPRPKLPTNLRGSVTPQITPRNTPLAPPSIAPAGFLLKPRIATATPLPSAAADTGQCRTDCAHTYYFCLSGQITTDCSTTWSQCLVSCSHPPLTIEH